MPDRAARPEAGPSGKEIEITPEMIEAGASYFRRYRSDRNDSDEFAKEAFLAMYRLRAA